MGSLVGQIAKIKGCRVVGSAGSPAKVEHLVKELGFDAAFDYKETKEYVAKLQEVCPQGIDVYFDNVGGPVTDAVFTQINVHARVGSAARLTSTTPPGRRASPVSLASHRQACRAEGFLVFDFTGRYAEARREIAQWLREGKIQYRETIAEGLSRAPRAFIGLFQGETSVNSWSRSIGHDGSPRCSTNPWDSGRYACRGQGDGRFGRTDRPARRIGRVPGRLRPLLVSRQQVKRFIRPACWSNDAASGTRLSQ